MPHQPIEAGRRQRLRDRLIADAHSPGDAEKLGLLPTYAIPRGDVAPPAPALLNPFGSLSAVLGASQDELEAVDGIEPSAAALLHLAGALKVQRDYVPEGAADAEFLEQPSLFATGRADDAPSPDPALAARASGASSSMTRSPKRWSYCRRPRASRAQRRFGRPWISACLTTRWRRAAAALNTWLTVSP